ncbi:thiol-disulfide isomerase/thioredoxin [Amycolatopsis bartoniae]|uniref:Cytochrome c biogenesis protein n=1 Tax=Amycolatopsis bartoniae TaxID=941986 RepID=A0A8H9J3Y7_9PSEU|nr:TlpA disulfide reductase family protein [Amycolatopsis bartoniae]MBB2935061.1 thiol-disulfide isomerase/thioredoxin [Amycolatopsis bartoniae]GHF74057.1 cytochrome c biogenesis protein [Amycolatopsis bartoniae]
MIPRLGSLLAAALLLAACSAGADPGAYQFVSPDGKTRLTYEPAERHRIGEVAGESVAEPGKRLDLADYAGNVVVLNIWASWCPPCRVETYELRKLADSTAGLPVRLLGIDVRDGRDSAADFVRNFQIGYPSIADPGQRVGLALRGIPLAAIPITVVVDRQQRVAAVYIGQVLASDVLPEIQRVAAEP